MRNPRWRKVVRDLWGNKVRTALVVMSIAVGVFAVGMVAGTQEILTRDMQATYLAIDPPAVILGLDRFDDDLVATIRRMPQIDDAEGRASISVRLLVGPETWRTLQIQAIPDFRDIRVNKIAPQQGDWPPPSHSMLVERSSLFLTNARIGDSVTIELPDGKRRSIRIAGTAHNTNMPPASFTGWVDGFVTFETIEWLGVPHAYSSLFLTVNDKTLDRDGVSRIANEVRDKIEAGGRHISFAYIPIPG
ncbi:MAG TPA: ABC transporter permease, partial [Roseiflexaceae bacterium]|nr:ABC transporter permease [Roseiflexaceae bacterium]